MPGVAAASAAAAATSCSASRPVVGRIWIVTSRATADCQSSAEAFTSMTAPTVSEARNVMMAMTASSARAAIESSGTMDDSRRCRTSGGACSMARPVSASMVCASFIVMQPSVVEHQTAGIELIHQRDVVGGDEDRGAGFVELDEQPQQPLGERRIDVACWLVGEQELGLRDHGARDCRALL